MYVICVHKDIGVCRTRNDTGFPKAEGTSDCEPIFTERTLGPLKEQQVFLTTEPSLQSFLFAFEERSLPGLESCQLYQAG